MTIYGLRKVIGLGVPPIKPLDLRTPNYHLMSHCQDASLQQSRAPIQTPNSRALLVRTIAKKDPLFG